MINQFKKIVLFKLLILIEILFKPLATQFDLSITIGKIEKKIPDHDDDKYIVTQEFNMLTKEKFHARLKEAKLAAKADIADFVKKLDFVHKLQIFNKKLL